MSWAFTSSLPARSLRHLAAATVLAGAASWAWAQGATTPPGPSAKTDYTHAELISDAAELVPGQTAWVGLRLRHEPHWHSYWRNPGDSGAPTTLQWALPPGFAAGEIQWPYPQRIPVAHLANYGFEGTVVLPVALQVPADAPAGQRVTLQVQANWLECSDVCIPASADLALTLPVAAAGGGSSQAPGDVQQALSQRVPVPLDQALPEVARGLQALASPTHLVLRLTGADWRSLEFFPYTEQLLMPAYVQPHARADGATRLQLRRAEGREGPWPQEPLAGVLVVRTADDQTRAYSLSVPVMAGQPELLPEDGATPAPEGSAPAALPAAAPAANVGLWAALLMALLGGAVLNLMPCVFPVLAIKSLGLIGQSAAHRRSHALGYALGVWLSMLALAGLLLVLRAAGQGLGWGFQLQSPGFVAAMAVLFLLLALNLAGMFELGLSVQRGAGDLAARVDAGTATGSAASRHLGAVADGALAVAIATPCTAPFMGAALGYAMQAPAWETMAVFTALALGLAAPVVVLTAWPAAARRLPRPGPWMSTLKTLFAFPLLATVAWLVWVLGQQTNMDAVGRLLGALVLVALAAWLWGRPGGLAWRSGGAAVAGALALALALPGLSAPPAEEQTASRNETWQPWSAGEVSALREKGLPVFVDYTAAWCITCQVNKKTVLETKAVQAAFREHGVVLMRADWTRRDADITRSLQALGRSGVPVYVLYGRDGQPRVLPELLTRGAVEEILKSAAPVAAAGALPPT